MLLMALAHQVSGTVACIVTVLRFLIELLNDTPNSRLVSFGRSPGRYSQQIVDFLTGATEDIPFPFNDRPGGT